MLAKLSEQISRLFILPPEEKEERSYVGGTTTLSSPDNWFLSLFRQPSSSGVTVNDETSLGLSAVWAAVRILSESIASLSWDIYTEDENGNRVAQPNHPVARLLRKPHALYSSYTWFEMMQAFAALRGNAISVIMRDKAGRPKGLRCFPVDQIQVLYRDEKIYYRVYDHLALGTFVVDYDDVIHLRALVMDPVSGWGKNPIEVHRESLGLGIAAQQYGGKFFKNGAHISGFLSTDQKLTAEAAERMRKSWQQRFGGLENGGATPVLEEGLKYVPLSLSPADSRYIETSRLSIEDVARIYRVPLHMLASLERATFSNIEHQSREFAMHTLRPWVKRWEDEINSKLFSDRVQGTTYFRFNLDSLLRGDSESRAKLIDTYMKWGLLTVNEIRRIEGFNATATGEGDVHLFPTNMAPLDQIRNQYADEEE